MKYPKLQLLEKSKIDYPIIHENLVKSFGHMMLAFDPESDACQCPPEEADIMCKGAAAYLNFFVGHLFGQMGLSEDEAQEVRKAIFSQAGEFAEEMKEEY